VPDNKSEYCKRCEVSKGKVCTWPCKEDSEYCNWAIRYYERNYEKSEQ